MEGGCSDAWNFVACNCANGSSQIKGIDFDQSYIQVAHADSFRIKIDISFMHKLNARILNFSNEFQDTNVTINEKNCVNPPFYYNDWFERSYPNVHINRYDAPFCLQCMNVIQGTNPAGRKWNILLDAVVTSINYKKSTIDHAI